MDQYLIIVRGVPGSGKTTYARRLWPDALHCEADDFWGDREFDPRLLGQAHADCARRVFEGMCRAKPVIVLSNTSTQLWEIEHYRAAARAAGYRVVVHTIVIGPDEIERCAARNVHSVPPDKVRQMLERFEYSTEDVLVRPDEVGL